MSTTSQNTLTMEAEQKKTQRGKIFYIKHSAADLWKGLLEQSNSKEGIDLASAKTRASRLWWRSWVTFSLFSLNLEVWAWEIGKGWRWGMGWDIDKPLNSLRFNKVTTLAVCECQDWLDFDFFFFLNIFIFMLLSCKIMDILLWFRLIETFLFFCTWQNKSPILYSVMKNEQDNFKWMQQWPRWFHATLSVCGICVN